MPFAGFCGQRVRRHDYTELAKAAGVSEALLYKHFPSKESLYAAMLDACVEGRDLRGIQANLDFGPIHLDAGFSWSISSSPVSSRDGQATLTRRSWIA